jgi:DNA-binding response OmpR family regulator
MTTKRSILIVEDDLALRQALVDHLLEDGAFQPVESTTLAAAMHHLDQETMRTDLVLLDLSLPDGDGLAFCAQLRRHGHHMPIIMLTGASNEADIVQGLQNGANDYVCKPFRAAELIARIRAQLRAFDATDSATFSVGLYIFRPATRTLVKQVDGWKIRLNGKETALLRYLLRLNGMAVEQQALLNAVWGYSSGSKTRTLETHIYRLRQKIEADPGKPQLLLRSSRGYRLVADVDLPGGHLARNDAGATAIRAA